MKKALSIAALAASFIAATPLRAAECPAVGEWRDPATNAIVPAPEAIERLAAGDVVLLGENHGIPDMQLWQAATAAAIAAKRGAAQYGYEMLPRAAQPALDAWARGETGRSAFLAEANWQGVWGFSPASYDPILRLPRLQNAPAIALNVNRSLVRKVGQEGWAATTEEERRGVSEPAPAGPAYRERLRAVLEAKSAVGAMPPAGRHGEKDAAPKDSPHEGHGAHQNTPAIDEAQLDRFVAAQQVWDRAFAEAIAKGRAERPGRPVIAFMGSGHVEYGHGVSWQLADLEVGPVRSAVAVFNGPDCAIEADSAGRPVADLVYGLPARIAEPGPPPRPRIGVFIKDAETGGAAITRVTEGSPAEVAGFLAGDVVTEAAGREVRNAAELGAAIRAHTWGAWLPFAVARNGEALELVAKLPKAPPQ